MFIKEAYDRRLKKELNSENDGNILQLSTAKIHTIGSIRNGKMNYDKDEQFFSKEDVPLNAKTIKEEVKQFVDPDLLGLRKKEWNNSSSVPKNPLMEETHERKLIKIKLGLFDHPIPKYTENIIYQGIETRESYAGWNVSSQIDNRFVRNHLEEMTEKVKIKNKEKEAGIIRNYIKPLDQQTHLTNQLRRQKSEEKHIRDNIRHEFMFTNPAASREKTDGAVFRLAYEAKLRKHQQANLDSKFTFKADLSKTLKQDITFKYEHSGVWQKQRVEKDDEGKDKLRDAWSCCMNEELQCRGCCPIKIDKNKWNLVSFNN